MRRTKILATLGPASAKRDVLEKMIDAGLDGVRLNFSHGTHDQHAQTFALVREVAAKCGKPVAILQDLQGPKIRVGKVKAGSFDVPTASTLIITTRKLEGEPGIVSTEYEALADDVDHGDRVLLDDGRIELSVREIRRAAGGADIVCDVLDGGVLSSHKGINVPGATLRADALTEKDKADVRFGLELGVDFVALSFVRRARDVHALRRIMNEYGKRVPIIAKIEKPQALDELERIVATCEGVMVARGDLGIEASLEMVPVYQKRIIQTANKHGKLVVTATQMLESMTENPMPTRAEVADVSNAILEGTDVVMLSGETAVGAFPVEAVRRMSSIAVTTEEKLFPFDERLRVSPDPNDLADFTSAIAHAAARAAKEVGARVIVVFSGAGQAATLLSDERPEAPVAAFARDEPTLRLLSLYWGVLPMALPDARGARDLEAKAAEQLIARGLVAPGEALVFAYGDAEDLSYGVTPNAIRIAHA